METLRGQLQQNLDRHERHEIALRERRAAAVALAVVADPDGAACFVLTRRASNLRNHPGQWALPGGRLDGAETAEEAALRELREEVGLDLPPASILGCLDDYETRSGFVITPVVVWGGAGVKMQADPNEVAEIHRVPLEALESPEIPHLRRIPESERPVISLPLVGTHIHAPTAAMIFQLREVAVWGRETRVHHYEQPVFAWR